MHDEPRPSDATKPIDSSVMGLLVANHRRFLTFLEARVGSRSIAEDILQAAFAKTVEKSKDIRESESALAWFYRLLKNAVIDHYRRQAAHARALDTAAREQAVVEKIPKDDELDQTICACFYELLPTLKDEYANMLRAVDLENESVTAVAKTLGITANNATVRLHRARQALRRRLEETCLTCAEHGCLDCTCGVECDRGKV